MVGKDRGGGFPMSPSTSPPTPSSPSTLFDQTTSTTTRADLDETQQSWLLSAPSRRRRRKMESYVDLGCVVMSRSMVKWMVGFAVTIGLVVGVWDLVKEVGMRGRKEGRAETVVFDEYWTAAAVAMAFFDAQKSGYLPKNSNVTWRGDSCVTDGFSHNSSKNLVGGYYDGGDAIKFNFPLSFSITLLSWSAIEYSSKYSYAGELDHMKDLIKWGTDYLLKTFDSSADTITSLTSQVGVGQKTASGHPEPNDGYCWERPEDIDYARPVEECSSCSDLAAEMAAALAAASIVFRDDKTYSDKLVDGAETLYNFGREHVGRYSSGNVDAALFYNSTGYEDELLWGATWLFYATGNITYLELATAPGLSAGDQTKHPTGIFSWNSKLLGSQVLLTRFRMFLSPGYPFEEQLKAFHTQVEHTMCSYLPIFKYYTTTKGGLLELKKHSRSGQLQYAVNAAFLASIFSDYMDTIDVPGWFCGPHEFYSTVNLRDFAKSQVDYLLGKNPRNMSYVVGYGDMYPKQVHHRGASIPNDEVRYGCRDGWRWRDSGEANPNTMTGAMVEGPDSEDGFRDLRNKSDYTGVSVAGNAGLVSALVSLSKTAAAAATPAGRGKWRTNAGIDRNTIFYRVPDMSPPLPTPPSPWKP